MVLLGTPLREHLSVSLFLNLLVEVAVEFFVLHPDGDFMHGPEATVHTFVSEVLAHDGEGARFLSLSIQY